MPEVLVSSTLLLLVIGGVVSAQMFGMKLAQINETKARVLRESTMTFNRLEADLQNGRQVSVGDGDLQGFTGGDDFFQGNALEIRETDSSDQYIRFYRDAADDTLNRTESGAKPQILARDITNEVVFVLQDLSGTKLTNHMSSEILAVSLEFEDNSEAAQSIIRKFSVR